MKGYIIMGVAFYIIYNKLQQDYQKVLADRQALLSILTPEQQQQLLTLINNTKSAAAQATAAVQPIVQQIQSALPTSAGVNTGNPVTNIPNPSGIPIMQPNVPFSGLGNVSEFNY